MNRHEFENKNSSDWKAFELQLESSKGKKENLDSHKPVSYTHLTLPTSVIV